MSWTGALPALGSRQKTWIQQQVRDSTCGPGRVLTTPLRLAGCTANLEVRGWGGCPWGRRDIGVERQEWHEPPCPPRGLERVQGPAPAPHPPDQTRPPGREHLFPAPPAYPSNCQHWEAGGAALKVPQAHAPAWPGHVHRASPELSDSWRRCLCRGPGCRLAETSTGDRKCDGVPRSVMASPPGGPRPAPGEERHVQSLCGPPSYTHSSPGPPAGGWVGRQVGC